MPSGGYPSGTATTPTARTLPRIKISTAKQTQNFVVGRQTISRTFFHIASETLLPTRAQSEDPPLYRKLFKATKKQLRSDAEIEIKGLSQRCPSETQRAASSDPVCERASFSFSLRLSFSFPSRSLPPQRVDPTQLQHASLPQTREDVGVK
ncbi:hypothetical protein E1301_Tti002447 [Triplophysa tibetana]|uniref:Uncharacterized protein n=1 Tax=Triplophysa tibetana TaxID=1572043 RepID=A0A5A9NDJ6_9TELE|nr:hypothetical protein E1301_Tti002447 [Triplophysa tibetana]